MSIDGEDDELLGEDEAADADDLKIARQRMDTKTKGRLRGGGRLRRSGRLLGAGQARVHRVEVVVAALVAAALLAQHQAVRRALVDDLLVRHQRDGRRLGADALAGDAVVVRARIVAVGQGTAAALAVLRAALACDGGLQLVCST